MDNEIIQSLIKIYNEFLKIHTCGEDSFIYATCMQNLMTIIQYIMQEQEIKEKKEE